MPTDRAVLTAKSNVAQARRLSYPGARNITPWMLVAHGEHALHQLRRFRDREAAGVTDERIPAMTLTWAEVDSLLAAIDAKGGQ